MGLIDRLANRVGINRNKKELKQSLLQSVEDRRQDLEKLTGQTSGEVDLVLQRVDQAQEFAKLAKDKKKQIDIQIGELKSRIRGLDREAEDIPELYKRNGNRVGDVEASQIKSRYIRETKQAISEEVKKLEQQKERLDLALVEIQAEIAEDNLAERESDLNDKTREVGKLSDQLDASREDYEKKSAAWKEAVSNTEYMQLAQLDAQIADKQRELDEAIARLNATASANEGDAATYDPQTGLRQGDVEASQSQLRDRIARAEPVRSEVQSIRRELEALQSKRAKTARIESMEEDLREAKQKQQETQAENQTRRDTLREQLNAAMAMEQRLKAIIDGKEVQALELAEPLDPAQVDLINALQQAYENEQGKLQDPDVSDAAAYNPTTGYRAGEVDSRQTMGQERQRVQNEHKKELTKLQKQYSKEVKRLYSSLTGEIRVLQQEGYQLLMQNHDANMRVADLESKIAEAHNADWQEVTVLRRETDEALRQVELLEGQLGEAIPVLEQAIEARDRAQEQVDRANQVTESQKKTHAGESSLQDNLIERDVIVGGELIVDRWNKKQSWEIAARAALYKGTPESKENAILIVHEAQRRGVMTESESQQLLESLGLRESRPEAAISSPIPESERPAEQAPNAQQSVRQGGRKWMRRITRFFGG